MNKTVLIAIGGGGLSAAASMAGLFGSPGGFILAYLAPLPLLLVGLGLGPTAVLIAAVTGVAGVGLLGGITSAGVYGGMHAFPSWLLIRQALTQTPSQDDGTPRWYPVGSVLCWLAAVGATIAIATVLAGRGEAGIEEAVQTLLETALSLAAPTLAEADRQSFALMMAPMFVGMTAMTWLLMMTINGILGQALLARRGWAIRPTPRWSDLTLPDWMSWLLVSTAAVAIVSSGDMEYMALNLMIIFAAPYFFLGLAVIHTLSQPLPARGIVLTAFYVALVLFLLIVGVAVAGLGVIEQWVGIRSRLAKAGPTQRSE